MATHDGPLLLLLSIRHAFFYFNIWSLVIYEIYHCGCNDCLLRNSKSKGLFIIQCGTRIHNPYQRGKRSVITRLYDWFWALTLYTVHYYTAQAHMREPCRINVSFMLMYFSMDEVLIAEKLNFDTLILSTFKLSSFFGYLCLKMFYRVRTYSPPQVSPLDICPLFCCSSCVYSRRIRIF